MMCSAATSRMAQGCRRLPFISDRECWIVQGDGEKDRSAGRHPSSVNISYMALNQ